MSTTLAGVEVTGREDRTIAVRLPHGYTNSTATDGRTVTKRYLGPDADRQRRCEVAALRGVSAVLPVPRLLDDRGDRVVTGWVPGTHGQDLLDDGHATRVLWLCGRVARAVHSVDPALVSELGGPGTGQTLIHGDFGPQNVLIDPATWTVTALLDWEFAGFGDPVRDLGWAEWIVRTHHPRLVPDLDALFDGYGERPSWERRKAAMLGTCRALLEFARRWDADSGAVEEWARRVRRTEDFHE